MLDCLVRINFIKSVWNSIKLMLTTKDIVKSLWHYIWYCNFILHVDLKMYSYLIQYIVASWIALLKYEILALEIKNKIENKITCFIDPMNNKW
jgi:hypothetical protein